LLRRLTLPWASLSGYFIRLKPHHRIFISTTHLINTTEASTAAMSPNSDNAMARFLFAILKQKNLKDVSGATRSVLE